MRVRMVCIVIFLLALAPQFVWSQAPSPLSYKDIVDRATDEPTYTCAAIQRNKVNFELTAEVRAKLKTADVKDEVLMCIEPNLAPATLVIQCKPVECEAFTGAQRLGQTKDGVLSLQFPPGTITVEARANGYRSMSTPIRLEINNTTTQPFVLDPLPGTLELSCDADGAECEIVIDNVAPQSTRQGRIQLGGLAPGEHRIKAAALGHLPQERTVSLKPGATDAAGITLGIDPKFVYDSMLKALGGKDNLAKAQTAQIEGNSTTRQPGGMSISAYFMESVSVPKGIRWDLQSPKGEECITAAVIGNLRWSKGWGRNGACSVGSTMLSDLELSVEAFKRMRVSDLISELQDDRKYQKRITKDGTTPQLVAQSSDETFTIRYDTVSFLPIRIIHEPRAGVGKAEVSLGRYAKFAGMALPCEMTITLPGDRPNFSHTIQVISYYLNPWFKPEEDFPPLNKVKFIPKPYTYTDKDRPNKTDQFQCN